MSDDAADQNERGFYRGNYDSQKTISRTTKYQRTLSTGESGSSSVGSIVADSMSHYPDLSHSEHRVEELEKALHRKQLDNDQLTEQLSTQWKRASHLEELVGKLKSGLELLRAQCTALSSEGRLIRKEMGDIQQVTLEGDFTRVLALIATAQSEGRKYKEARYPRLDGLVNTWTQTPDLTERVEISSLMKQVAELRERLADSEKHEAKLKRECERLADQASQATKISLQTLDRVIQQQKNQAPALASPVSSPFGSALSPKRLDMLPLSSPVSPLPQGEPTLSPAFLRERERMYSSMAASQSRVGDDHIGRRPTPPPTAPLAYFSPGRDPPPLPPPVSGPTHRVHSSRRVRWEYDRSPRDYSPTSHHPGGRPRSLSSPSHLLPSPHAPPPSHPPEEHPSDWDHRYPPHDEPIITSPLVPGQERVRGQNDAVVQLISEAKRLQQAIQRNQSGKGYRDEDRPMEESRHRSHQHVKEVWREPPYRHHDEPHRPEPGWPRGRESPPRRSEGDDHGRWPPEREWVGGSSYPHNPPAPSSARRHSRNRAFLEGDLSPEGQSLRPGVTMAGTGLEAGSKTWGEPGVRPSYSDRHRPDESPSRSPGRWRDSYHSEQNHRRGGPRRDEDVPEPAYMDLFRPYSPPLRTTRSNSGQGGRGYR